MANQYEELKPFQREDRYVVIKLSDLAGVPEAVGRPFAENLSAIQRRLPKRECLVIESDWPEYQVAWRMIEARMGGSDELSAIKGVAAGCTKPGCFPYCDCDSIDSPPNPPAQPGKAVALQHVAVSEDGALRWITGRKFKDCELYAMPGGGRAPAQLYTAPPASGAVPEHLRELLERLAKDADLYDDTLVSTINDNCGLWQIGYVQASITVGDLRELRALLAKGVV